MRFELKTLSLERSGNRPVSPAHLLSSSLGGRIIRSVRPIHAKCRPLTRALRLIAAVYDVEFAELDVRELFYVEDGVTPADSFDAPGWRPIIDLQLHPACSSSCEWRHSERGQVLPSSQ